jgi:hypothetical protein
MGRIEQHHITQVPGRGSTDDITLIPYPAQGREVAAMVNVGMGEYYGVE